MCPVLSLRAYLEHTKSAVSRASLLFVSSCSLPRQISKNTVSFFLREVISGAGAVREDVGTPLRVHSVGGVATATVFMQSWSVPKVLEAASSRSASVFTSFYLLDVQYGTLWKACVPLAQLSLRVQSFHLGLAGFFDEPSLILRLFFCVLGCGILGSSHFGVKCESLGSLGVAFLSLKGDGYLGLNAVWVLVGWQCWLGFLPLPPSLPPVCLCLPLLVEWLVALMA